MTYSVSINQMGVGQGEAALIVVKQDDSVVKSILVDSGFDKTASMLADNLLLELEGTALSAVVITHYDRDHFRGIQSIIKDYSFCINEDTIFYDTGVSSSRVGDSTYPIYVRQLITLSLRTTIKNHIKREMFTSKDALELIFDIYSSIFASPNLINANNLQSEFKEIFSDGGEDKKKIYRAELDKQIKYRTRFIKSDRLYYENIDEELISNFDSIFEEYTKQLIKSWPSLLKDKHYLVGEDLLKLGDSAPTLTCLTMNNDSGSDGNNDSIALILRLGEFSFYTAGDLESEYEDELIPDIGNNISAFKTGHHGSDKSTSSAFLDNTNPVLALISSGIGKKLPATNLLKRLSLSRRTQRVLLTQVRPSILLELTKKGKKFSIAGNKKRNKVIPGNINITYIQDQKLFTVFRSVNGDPEEHYEFDSFPILSSGNFRSQLVITEPKESSSKSKGSKTKTVLKDASIDSDNFSSSDDDDHSDYSESA